MANIKFLCDEKNGDFDTKGILYLRERYTCWLNKNFDF